LAFGLRLKTLSGTLLLLSISSYWQVSSGYVDVFSHRFIFKTVDPTLNPAHVSLYSASLLGFFMVYFALKKGGDSEGKRIIRPGILLAFLGAAGEVISGGVNELYHRVFVNTPTTAPAHLAIHGLFVISMFIVAVGAIVSVVVVLASPIGSTYPHLSASLGILVSSAWMLIIGSVSYLAAISVGDVSGTYFLVAGSFFASGLSVATLLIANRFGFVTVAAVSFFLFNAGLLYGFERSLYLLPVPVLSAVIGEVIATRLRRFSRLVFSLTNGAVFGLLSYWLLYPYSYSFFDFENVPTALFGITAPSILVLGLAGGVVAFLIVKSAANILAARFGS